MITDYVTGREVANIGAEEHRQAVEKFLVKDRGYAAEDIHVDVDIALEIGGESYHSQLDLVVIAAGRAFMVIKCAAASLESREREVIAAARLLAPEPAPLAVVSDGETAVIYDALLRKKIGEGLSEVPARSAAEEFMADYKPEPSAERVWERDKIVFRSYDSMNRNVQRNIR
jgi:hypothetical protein